MFKPSPAHIKAVLFILCFNLFFSALYSETNENFIKGLKSYSEKKFLMAIGSFKKALDEGFKNPTIYFFLGNSYVNNGDFDKALDVYKISFESADKPDLQGIITHNIGYVYFLKKEYAKSIDYLNQSYQLDSNLVQTYWFKGMAYYKMKDKNNTIREWEDYLVKAPRGPQSDNIRRALAILKSSTFDFDKDKLFPYEGDSSSTNKTTPAVEPLIDIEGVLDQIKPVDKGKVIDNELEEIEK